MRPYTFRNVQNQTHITVWKRPYVLDMTEKGREYLKNENTLSLSFNSYHHMYNIRTKLQELYNIKRK